MLLEKDDFPAETIVDKVHSPIADMPAESASIYADYKGSAILHEIARFPSSTLAEEEFDGARKRASGQTENEGPWESPSELSYVSSFFENYYVSCGNVLQGEYQCRMVGQYKEYYVFFFAYITDNGLTLATVNGLLEKIDKQTEQCINE
jgi:hypothetical protein